MISPTDAYGLMVIDRGECSIGVLRGERIECKWSETSLVPRKHSHGGQSAQRMARIIQQIADAWFRECCEIASEIFLKENVKGVILGGPGGTVKYSVNKEDFHYQIRDKIIDIIDVGDTTEQGLRELVNNAKPTLRKLGLTHERDLLEKFLREIICKDDLIVYGIEQVKHALTIGAVDTLLISESLMEKEDWQNLSEQTGSKIELISNDTEESKQFVLGFDGIAAFLRYKIS